MKKEQALVRVGVLGEGVEELRSLHSQAGHIKDGGQQPEVMVENEESLSSVVQAGERRPTSPQVVYRKQSFSL